MPAVLLSALLAAAAAVASPASAAPLTESELAARAAAFRSADPKARLAAAEFLAHLPPEAEPMLARRLLHPLQTSPDTFRRLFLGMWAQVPNWISADPMWIRRPEPPWVAPPRVRGQPRAHRPKPHDPETLDWLSALNEVDLGDPIFTAPAPLPGEPPPPPQKPAPRKAAVEPAPVVAPPLPPTRAELEIARAEAMEEVALLRAIASTQRMDAVDPMFALAFVPGGVFRDECGRQIRSMGSFAVPALIRLMHQRGPAALHLSKQRRYAAYQLDRMDRAQPQKAIASAPDDRVKSAIIHQYGQERALEAVDAILGQVDAPSHRVRKEARWAWLRYVTGPPPPPAPMRKRKLTGGREEDEEKPDYLTYRELALLALQKQVQAIENAPPDPKATAKELTDRLFGYYDRQRAAEWEAELSAGRARAQAGDLKGAIDHFGWILAHDPNFARRGEMVEAYLRYGEALRRARRIPEALGYLRQAVDLDPSGPHAHEAAARVALLDGVQALAHGRAEPELFRRALALDPSLAEAKGLLERAEALRDRRKFLQGGAAAAAGCALLFLIWLLWRRILPRGEEPAPPSS
ncbi:MAG TPA: hypothetical protein VII38_03795 [Polyangia bacterium]